MYGSIHWEEIRDMDSVPLMLNDDPFDFDLTRTLNLNPDLIYHPSFQPQPETLPTQQIPPVTATTTTRIPNTDNSSNDARKEGIGAASDTDGRDLDNIDPGVENGDDDVHRVGKRQKKMVVHREVERQRRQEMASLHASLRSLLPLEYLKGKRSMSDHLNEAVKYIHHLKASNQLLTNKKDQLRTSQNNNETSCTPNTNPMYVAHDHHHHHGEPNKDFLASHCSSRSSDRVVVVNACNEGGVEVVLRIGQEDKLPLSFILKTLEQGGLDVTQCSCTNVGNNVLLHCLQAQAREGISIDVSKLQQQLCYKRLEFVKPH